MDSLVSLLEANAKEVPDRPAFQHWDLQEDGSYRSHVATWRQIDSWGLQLAFRLSELGVSQGDLVASWMPNSPEWIAADFACQIIGAIHVPLDPRLNCATAQRLVAHSQAKILLVQHGSAQAGAYCDSPRPSSTKVHALQLIPQFHQRVPEGRKPDWEGSWSGGKGLKGTAKHMGDHCRADTIANILYTSGTQGDPKGVMLSQSNLLSNARGKLRAMPQNAKDIRLNILPFAHAYARTCELSTWVISRSQLVLASSVDEMFRLAPLLEPTLINAVPFVFQKCLLAAEQLGGFRSDTFSQLLGSRIRILASGGAPLTGHLDRAYRSIGISLLQGYGLTETSPVVCSNLIGLERGDTVGPPIENVECRIENSGELWVRGPNVMRGYWRNPTATDEKIVDGWLRTGDLAEQSEGGHFRIVGRCRDTIVLSTGKKIEPLMIEQSLKEDSWFEHVVVIGEGFDASVAIVQLSPIAIGELSDRLHVVVRDRSPCPVEFEPGKLQRELLKRSDRILREFPSYCRPKAILAVSRPLKDIDGLFTSKDTPRRDQFAVEFGFEAASLLASRRTLC